VRRTGQALRALDTHTCSHQYGKDSAKWEKNYLVTNGRDIRKPDIITSNRQMRESSDEKMMEETHICQAEDM
jgi:hypothetical protein